MTPTIEEVKRIAEEKGAKLNYRQFNFSEEKYLHGFETMEHLQAFAQHWIEVGRKEQREKDSEICEKLADDYRSKNPYSDSSPLMCNCWQQAADAIRNNTGE